MGKIIWETLEESHAGFMYRTKVPGGWIVKHVMDVRSPMPDGYGGQEYRDNAEWRSSITFVPDPNNNWEVP